MSFMFAGMLGAGWFLQFHPASIALQHWMMVAGMLAGTALGEFLPGATCFAAAARLAIPFRPFMTTAPETP
jgi:hypothetical protein